MEVSGVVIGLSKKVFEILAKSESSLERSDEFDEDAETCRISGAFKA